jgi:hypothetical protein
MANSLILQELLGAVGNTGIVESAGDLKISGLHKAMRMSIAHLPGAATTQAGGTQLTAMINLVSPFASNTAFVLPSPAGGVLGFGPIYVKNDSSTTQAEVFPPAGHYFHGLSAPNLAFGLPSYVGATFVGISNTSWLAMRDAGSGRY